MPVLRLGDGDDSLADTLGSGILGTDTFSTGARGSLFLGLRSARHRDQLLMARAAAEPSLGLDIDQSDRGGDGGIGSGSSDGASDGPADGPSDGGGEGG